MSKKVTIIDYGLGNLFSVAKAFEHVGGKTIISGNPEEIVNSERLILPGVGAFKIGMEGLKSRGLVSAIQSYAKSGKPLIGVCLGMQMFFDKGEENGSHQGLGIISGKVVKIPAISAKIPHIGWSCLQRNSEWNETIIQDTPPDNSFYFVHSYHAECSDNSNLLAYVNYGGVKVSAVVRSGNVYGCQFHPEKSGEFGLAICNYFLQMKSWIR